MTYENSDDVRPTTCPVCGTKLVLRWYGVRAFSLGRPYVARASPLFVCTKCQLSVRIFTLPDEPLRKTGDEAREDVHRLGRKP